MLKQLKASHESSLRILQVLTLEPLLENERVRVLDSGLAEGEKVNGYRTQMTEEAKQLISELSEGYPHFIQQFAHSAFDADTDDVIDADDVQFSVHRSDVGAIEQLGIRYFQDLYFEQIGSDEYRQVLRVMADRLDGWVTKAEIRKEAKIKESALNNAITALKARHIILSKPGMAGVYKLPTKSFAVWIRAFSKS